MAFNRRMFLAGAGTAVALPAINRLGYAQSLDTIILAMPNAGLLNTPLFTASAMGLFEKHGINIQYEFFKGGVPATAALVGGAAHMTPESAASIIRANLNGAGVEIVGGQVMQYAANLMVSSKFLDGRDASKMSLDERLGMMKGMNLAVTGTGSGTHQIAVYLAKKAGLDPEKDMTIAFLGTGDAMVAALGQGMVDGVILASPSVENAQRQHDAQLLIAPQLGEIEELDPFLYVSFNAASAWLESNEELGKRFMQAVSEAMAYLKSGSTDEGRRKVKEAFLPKLDDAVYAQAWDFMEHAFPSSPSITGDDVRKVLTFIETATGEKLEIEPTAVFNPVLIKDL